LAVRRNGINSLTKAKAMADPMPDHRMAIPTAPV
jgi:hypothetical protein